MGLIDIAGGYQQQNSETVIFALQEWWVGERLVFNQKCSGLLRLSWLKGFPPTHPTRLLQKILEMKKRQGTGDSKRGSYGRLVEHTR